ncbi:hypothetical protein HELRODRAFT_175116 [Helobdella robusta]|uniref:Uncharacterized protein n=1 Tax=Helobdella robusta TaxID=6412 RepID=T1F8V7_HELRO|nr:hypothetical protein HELRODRAFT_175116 [Helobdella robusta]ESO01089.1 hypothetical protein HELRODRAFT_175116 [Helobdella robusta]
MSRNRYDSGDLGLGFGLKPGSLIIPDSILPDSNLDSCANTNSDSVVVDGDKNGEMSSSSSDADEFSSRSTKKVEEVLNVNGGKSNSKSFEDSLKNHSTLSIYIQKFQSERSMVCLKAKIHQEIDSLNHELESVKQQLTSKKQGIRILQQELQASKLENEHLKSKLKWLQDILIKDFNSLQFNVARERLVMNENKEFYQSKHENTPSIQTSLSRASAAYSNASCCVNQTTTPFINGVLDCSCHCFDYKRCPCAKIADQLHQQNKALITKLTTCENIDADESNTQQEANTTDNNDTISTSNNTATTIDKPTQNNSSRTFKKIIHEKINLRYKS